jgi:hypothetical protein
VRDEIKRVLHEQIECRVKKVYDEDGRLVETDYTYFVDEGHIVHYITKHQGSNMEFYAGHSRTHKNWEEARESGHSIDVLNKDFNKEKVFQKNGAIPAGFHVSPNGIIIPESKEKITDSD